MRGAGAVAIALLTVAVGAPYASAAPDDPYHAMAALDGRVQSVGWRLARANAPLCKDIAPATGLLVQDLQSWADPDGARAAFGTGPQTQVVVGAVAAGSPAEKLGFRTGQPIRTIIDTVLDSDLPEAEAGSYERQTGLLDLIDSSLAQHGWVAIGIDDEAGKRRIVRIGAEDTCASRFEIVTRGRSAEADGRRVLVSSDLAVELTADDQFTFVVAHELAHNILDHPAQLKAQGRKRRHVRATEREADRLAVWLMVNAGYDTAGAAGFLNGWARTHDRGFLGRTHDAWDERLAAVEVERALIAARPDRPGGYDWSARFPQGHDGTRSDE